MISPLKNYCPQMWAGIECSINRVENTFFNQLEFSSHYSREGDIDAIASLGVSALRYPLLWEQHQKKWNEKINWGKSKQRIDRILATGMEPIAGLLHHGSGPPFTHLLDNEFPALFAQYAGEAAKNFTGIKYFTPINEPLTTARFSGLYGHWFPHRKDEYSFAKIFLNEMKAIILAMKAIQKIIPEAMLMQTEDLGETFSTPLLKYQADFENERRWITYDILCGKFNRHHRMWQHFKWAGIEEEELTFFENNFFIPAIIGINHYITSERFLDDNLQKYPSNLHGNNGNHFFADVEAIRIQHSFHCGIKNLLQQAQQRYTLPLAVTEVHMHCHREHQLRWLTEIWNECMAFNTSGGNVQAVTAWALFGSFGWNKLLTALPAVYECGAFDLKAPSKPRRTALANCVSSLAKKGAFIHPIVADKGWWHFDSRFMHRPSALSFQSRNESSVLIVGKNGTLGKAFSKICTQRFISHHLIGRDEADITDAASIERVISNYRPWALINAAGFVDVDKAEEQKTACYQSNTLGAENLARACQQHGIKLVTFSTDLVFDGIKRNPLNESESVNPLNVYGDSKAKAEAAVLRVNPQALIIRTSAFFSAWDTYNFAHQLLQKLKLGQCVKTLNDVWVSPTYIPDLVHATLDLLMDDEEKIYHLCNEAEVTWLNFAYQICDRAALPKKFIQQVSLQELNPKAKRPQYSVLGSERVSLLPPLENALACFFNEYQSALNFN